jgi:putative DNA primase/helicase
MSGPFQTKGLAYIEQGYAIVPIPRGSKGPTLDDWQTEYASTAERHTELVEDYGNCGIGIIAKFNPAIDIDTLDEAMSEHMIEWVRDNIADAPLRYGQAPKALMLFTCATPFRKITSAKYIRPGGSKKGERVEILGNGQQFVADHIHPDTNKPYFWQDDDASPLTVNAIDLHMLTLDEALAVCREFERVAELRGWEKVSNATNAQGDDEDTPTAEDALGQLDLPEETEEEIARVKSALEAMDPEVEDYSYEEWRNVLFALKWTQWSCAEELAREWSERSDKYDAKNFRTVWKGAQKRQRGREHTLATVFHMAKSRGWDASRKPTEEDKTELLYTLLSEADALSQIVRPGRALKELLKKLATADLDNLDEAEVLKAIKASTKDSIADLKKAVGQFKKGGDAISPTHAGYAKSFLAKLEERSDVDPVGVEGMIFHYVKRKGVWDGLQAPDAASVKVADEFDGMEHCERRSDYTAIANHAYSIAAQENEDFFNDAPVGLACQGRFYSVNAEGEIEREPIGPQHRQRVLSPVRPIAGDKPLFEKFLHSTFEGEGEQDQIDLLQEVIGATLVGTMAKYEKVVLFKGPGRAGKGTLMKIIEAMMPPEWRSAISPFKWDNEYYLASLAGKRLNLVGELTDEIPIPAANFKTVTGRDILQGRHPAGRPFNFRNQAAHIFNSNYFVHTKDHSDAFFSRWILMEFRNSRIGSNEIETDLAKRIIDGELSQIMAWALQGAKRLQARDRFLDNSVQARMLAQWSRRTSSLTEFVLDPDFCILTRDKNDHVLRSDFYKSYAQWCKESNRHPMGKIKAFDELESSTFRRLDITVGTVIGKNFVVRGMRLKTSEWDHLSREDDQEL